MADNMIYRLDIVYPLQRTGKFRMYVRSDDGITITGVANKIVATKPKISEIRAWLKEHGFEAYGDLRQIGDRTLRSMVRPIV